MTALIAPIKLLSPCLTLSESKLMPFSLPATGMQIFDFKQSCPVGVYKSTQIAAFELIKARLDSLQGSASGSVTQPSDIASTTIAKSPQGTMFYRKITASNRQQSEQSVIANLLLGKAFITVMGFHTAYWDDGRQADLGLPLSDEYKVQINSVTGARQDLNLEPCIGPNPMG